MTRERRTPADLVTQWRERADERERRANATSDLVRAIDQRNMAAVERLCAAELEAALRQAQPMLPPQGSRRARYS